MPTIARPLAFSCPHVPLLQQEAKEFLFAQIEEHKPTHIIGLGDWHEADGVNRFGVEYDWTLGYEMEEVAKFCAEIRTLANRVLNQTASFVWMEGNHDWNIRDWKRSSKQLVDLMDYRNHETLGRELDNWYWIPYEFDVNNGVYRLGQLVFCHGFKAGIGADKKMAMASGMVLPYGLYVGGHTHRPKDVTPLDYYSRPLDISACNVGTLGDIWNGFSYMQKQDRSQWGQGVFVGECELWRYTDSFIPNSKRWDGEVRIRRMFNEGRDE
jgi:predicted phosphodiesterase